MHTTLPGQPYQIVPVPCSPVVPPREVQCLPAPVTHSRCTIMRLTPVTPGEFPLFLPVPCLCPGPQELESQLLIGCAIAPWMSVGCLLCHIFIYINTIPSSCQHRLFNGPQEFENGRPVLPQALAPGADTGDTLGDLA